MNKFACAVIICHLVGCTSKGSFVGPDTDCEIQSEGGGGSANVDLTPASPFAKIHLVQGESVVVEDNEPGDQIQASAKCPEGEFIVSGGCETWHFATEPSDGCVDPYLFYGAAESFSYSEPYLLDGWLCMARTTCAGANGIVAYVNCSP